MNELIKINEVTISGDVKQTVNARDLHRFLEIGKDFSNWMKDQIQRARLVENQDFIKVAEKGELSITGQTKLEYYITIEAGKHIGMMSQSDKGFQVRDYFIECERIAKEKTINPIATLSDPIVLTKMLIESLAIMESQKQQLIEQKPKVDFYNTVTDSADCIDFATVAKLLKIKGLGRNNLMARLRDDNILQKDNIPYQRFVDMGLFRVIETKFIKPDDSTHINIKTLTTQKGVDYIIQKYKNE